MPPRHTPIASTLADYVGHDTVLLRDLVDLIETHILAGERIHDDNTDGAIQIMDADSATKIGPWLPPSLMKAPRSSDTSIHH